MEDCSRSSANDALQSALVLGSGSSIPDNDGGGGDGPNDGGVKVHNHRLQQIGFLQLPQEDFAVLSW